MASYLPSRDAGLASASDFGRVDTQKASPLRASQLEEETKSHHPATRHEFHDRTSSSRGNASHQADSRHADTQSRHGEQDARHGEQDARHGERA